MPLPTFHADTPGLLTTIQDSGRSGFAAQGVPVGGAADAWAAQVANLLAGNPPGAASLEMTLTGPALRVLRDVTVAVCGANLSPFVDDKPLPMWRTARLGAGQTLRFARRESGARAYLAVAGGLSVPRVLGSRSTLLRAGWGGLGGRALRSGDVLEADAAPGLLPPAGRGLRPADIPRYPALVALRVVLGPQDDLFSDSARHAFLTAQYEVTAQSDRMGLRLQGPPLETLAGDAGALASEGVAFGCVQVAGSQPVLLMVDCQTTGGYPVMGVVIRADLSQAAQCVPGTMAVFQAVSLEEAQNAARAQTRFLRALAGAVGR